eukprot:SAG22_NODE_12874_length_426_cov_1.119266_1_plen_31_part_01
MIGWTSMRIQKMDNDNFWVYTAKGGPKSKIW